MRRIAFIFAALTLFTLFGGVAVAAAPANDDIANAVGVTGLPFVASVDIAEATQAPGDLHCGTLPDGNTVWYKITPSSDLRIGFHVETSVQELSISIGTGSPGSLTLVQCSFSSTDALDATAGTTYYIQLGTCCGVPGGPVTVSMQEVAPLSADIRIDHRGQIDDAGLVEVSGKIRCNRQTPSGSETVVQGRLRQGDANGWLVPVHFSDGCSALWKPWSTTVQVLSADGFDPGRAGLEATVFACDEFGTCAEPGTKTGDVRLR